MFNNSYAKILEFNFIQKKPHLKMRFYVIYIVTAIILLLH